MQVMAEGEAEAESKACRFTNLADHNGKLPSQRHVPMRQAMGLQGMIDAHPNLGGHPALDQPVTTMQARPTAHAHAAQPATFAPATATPAAAAPTATAAADAAVNAGSRAPGEGAAVGEASGGRISGPLASAIVGASHSAVAMGAGGTVPGLK